MERMKLKHHKWILSITTILMTIVGIYIGTMISKSGSNALLIMIFSLMLIVIVLNFITTSILLRTREELHALYDKEIKKK